MTVSVVEHLMGLSAIAGAGYYPSDAAAKHAMLELAREASHELEAKDTEIARLTAVGADQLLYMQGLGQAFHALEARLQELNRFAHMDQALQASRERGDRLEARLAEALAGPRDGVTPTEAAWIEWADKATPKMRRGFHVVLGDVLRGLVQDRATWRTRALALMRVVTEAAGHADLPPEVGRALEEAVRLYVADCDAAEQRGSEAPEVQP